MKRFSYFLLVAIPIAVVIVAVYLLRVQGKPVAQVTPTPSESVQPSFSQTGEVVAFDGTQLTISFLRSDTIMSSQVPQRDTLSTLVAETTRVFRRSSTVPNSEVTESPATIGDIKVGQTITIQMSDKDGIALFPEKITILP